MGTVPECIDGRLREFVLAQPVFFVATAPSGPAGHVNVSPKGMRGCFAVFDAHRVGYLDYTGSGAETIAHLYDNGRITLMFCAFEGPPSVVRLHGQGRVVRPGQAGFDECHRAFDSDAGCGGGDGLDHGLRSIIVVDVERISTSCGFAVPLMTYLEDRTLLGQWSRRKTDEELAAYRAQKNATSIDGLPALAPSPSPVPSPTP